MSRLSDSAKLLPWSLQIFPRFLVKSFWFESSIFSGALFDKELQRWKASWPLPASRHASLPLRWNERIISCHPDDFFISSEPHSLFLLGFLTVLWPPFSAPNNRCLWRVEDLIQCIGDHPRLLFPGLKRAMKLDNIDAACKTLHDRTNLCCPNKAFWMKLCHGLQPNHSGYWMLTHRH